jgi:hypothetical protein
VASINRSSPRRRIPLAGSPLLVVASLEEFVVFTPGDSGTSYAGVDALVRQVQR